jgi:hypothetical protein
MARVTRRPLSAAIAAGVILASGCTTQSAFDDRSLDELEAGLDDHGLTICGQSTESVDLPGATSTTTYDLAFDCDTDGSQTDGSAFVAVTEYDNRDDRDGAAAQFETKPTSGLGAVWTFGPYTVVLSGPRDNDVADAVTETLDDLDAT